MAHSIWQPERWLGTCAMHSGVACALHVPFFHLEVMSVVSQVLAAGLVKRAFAMS